MHLCRVLFSFTTLACLSCVSIGEMLAPTYDLVVLDQRPDPIYEKLSANYATKRTLRSRRFGNVTPDSKRVSPRWKTAFVR